MRNYKFPVHTCTGDIIKFIEFSGEFNDEEDAPYQETAIFKANELFWLEYPERRTCGQCGDTSVQLSEQNHNNLEEELYE